MGSLSVLGLGAVASATNSRNINLMIIRGYSREPLNDVLIVWNKNGITVLNRTELSKAYSGNIFWIELIFKSGWKQLSYLSKDILMILFH